MINRSRGPAKRETAQILVSVLVIKTNGCAYIGGCRVFGVVVVAKREWKPTTVSHVARSRPELSGMLESTTTCLYYVVL